MFKESLFQELHNNGNRRFTGAGVLKSSLHPGGLTLSLRETCIFLNFIQGYSLTRVTVFTLLFSRTVTLEGFEGCDSKIVQNATRA